MKIKALQINKAIEEPSLRAKERVTIHNNQCQLEGIYFQIKGRTLQNGTLAYIWKETTGIWVETVSEFERTITQGIHQQNSFDNKISERIREALEHSSL